MSVAETIFLCPAPEICVSLACRGSFLWKRRWVLYSARNRRTARQLTGQAHHLLDEPDVVCQRIGQGAFNVERACRLSAWWQAARPFHNKC
jgi:hypothetical protein